MYFPTKYSAQVLRRALLLDNFKGLILQVNIQNDQEAVEPGTVAIIIE